MPGKTVAVVLAGGEARRMGRIDKPLLEIGGVTLLARVIAALADMETAISANGDPGRFAQFGLPVVTDGPFEGHGPLAGVLAGLDWAASRNAETMITVPGDTPYIPHGLARALAPAPACAASAGQVHHLVTLWPVAARLALHAFLSVPGPRGVVAFSAGLGMRLVEFPADTRDPFLNVNTPDDLAAARGLHRTAGRESGL